MQPHYNLIYREEERETMPLCEAEGVGVIPWSPLARGRLARPWNEETARTASDEFGKTLYVHAVDSDRQVIERVGQVAEARGVPRAQVALAWMLQKSFITAPIIGASKAEQLDDAAAAVALKLTPEEISSLEEPYAPHPIVGF